MDARQTALWRSILDFEFDDDPQASYRFIDRLMEENRWPPLYAQRTILEYRRFLFLAAEAGHPVTPSKVVDEVWHLHLLYTRSYWERLCGTVLGKPLHHQPSRGGKTEDER